MSSQVSIPDEVLISKIYLVRGVKIMLDSELAELYQVETKRLNEQVRRNIDRFPEDFMFQMTKEEWEDLKSQNATSRSWGGRRTPPLVFTEHGVLMLSSVLNSERAIAVNIRIMRIFTRMKKMLMTNQEILLKVEQMERRVAGQDEIIQHIFEYLKQLIKEQDTPRKQIGFKTKKK
ncbi:MAG: DNA-binding protein [Nitrospira bacterium SG8_35_1]|nr:MAG: DNA-binding protein [Nitrospira bacterium SG8_35_1]